MAFASSVTLKSSNIKKQRVMPAVPDRTKPSHTTPYRTEPNPTEPRPTINHLSKFENLKSSKLGTVISNSFALSCLFQNLLQRLFLYPRFVKINGELNLPFVKTRSGFNNALALNDSRAAVNFIVCFFAHRNLFWLNKNR